jgi:hypothetical protein
VTQDPRKVPFLFEYLFTEVADPRHEQVCPSVDQLVGHLSRIV